MKHLYAPWRKAYMTGHDNTACVFCLTIAKDQDAQRYIIKRFQHCYVMLNLYPYNAGHLLVVPFMHQASLEQLDTTIRQEIMEVTTQSITILKKTLNAEGINVGLNIGGKAAGGSIPNHLHMHVLPRWLGDTNFLATLAETKQISLDLSEMYEKLHAAFNQDKSQV
jgi:ATP adenylyltransferase